MKQLLKLFGIIPFLFVFLFSLYVPVDPDLGWHLKNGEYFFQHGTVLRDNVYTTMMPNYHWANTSWLTDVLTYTIFSTGGFWGLTIASGLIVTGTFFFFSRAAKLQLWDQVFLFPLILYLVQPINMVSFRGQLISLLFVGILFYILSLYHKHPKSIYFLFPLFFLWANLHGEFILGLVLLGLWIFLFFIQQLFFNKAYENHTKQRSKHFFNTLAEIKQRIFIEKRNFLFFIAFFLGCVVVTFINPFGWNIHMAAISHIGSPLLQAISEYLPFDSLSLPWWNQVIAAVLLTFGFIALFFQDKIKEKFPLLAAGVLLFFFSFEIRRYAWPAYYLILPLLTPFSGYLKPDNKKLTLNLARVFACILLAIALFARYPFTPLMTHDWNSYCEKMGCSPQSIAYLYEHKLTENVFTLYAWGGWMIWNYPEIKPVIDGRMHLWSENGYSAFEEYFDLEQTKTDIDKTKYNTVLMSPDKAIYDRLIKLENAGKWKMVYSDDYSAVFVRNTKK